MADIVYSAESEEYSRTEITLMQIEASWLIKKEVPVVCKRVKRILERCVNLLRPDTQSSKAQSDNVDDSTATSQTSSNTVDINNIFFNAKTATASIPSSLGLNATNLTSSRRGSSDTRAIDMSAACNQVNIEELDDIYQDQSIENKPINIDTPEGTRGTLHINGWLVESPELMIRFNKPAKQNYTVPVYKTLINKSHPWRIQQIQNSNNYLHLILTEINSLLVFAESYTPLDSYQLNNHHGHPGNHLSSSSSSSTISQQQQQQHAQAQAQQQQQQSQGLSASQSGWVPSGMNKHHSNSLPELHSLVEAFGRISEWLQMARDELLLPSRNVFPNTMYQPTVLQPPLPFEINVNLTVSNCELVFSVYELHITSTPLDGQRGAQNLADTNSPSKSLRKSQKLQPTLSSSSSSLQLSSGSVPRSSSPASGDSTDASKESQETSHAHNIPPFQTTKGGSAQWVTVIDHSEFRQAIPTLLTSFTLLTNAYDILADLGEKLLVLSNVN
ncbi:hypothetical protein SAMD00019534_123570 [Acytostelium subglobosum LB1]|uniref:hypothetical protein n=1 Tax=Acytostelium subglobosum LB1 TaxID=1410327 RepID=UPI000644AE65|nr:hypothetical protein SAMD00019534_123570 [Acytostelium subglobosum LB1]GAM29181.1 hypothetical protein SAMD00019534_123570 [Acytostelium subglobosum LB1]|eukprot:XP_012747872.1 hypothetical protein SAMD00019534_123570 [Acytostelium subglobosum LB1]